MTRSSPDPEFWRGKRVLLTGQTGFKGSWAALWLARLGASVTGLALATPARADMAGHIAIDRDIDSQIGDIRDRARVIDLAGKVKPQIVIHMAAQSLVRPSYADPVATWSTNVMGTMHVLESLRAAAPRVTALIVTSDKVYRNDETGRAFVETDALGGHDPYSASKAACETLTASWRDSFAADFGATIATARAGNVVGGGDFSVDRIVPDVWRAIRSGQPVVVRNPHATRPWQHVLDCLNGYLLYIEALSNDRAAPLALNFGPAKETPLTVAEIADTLLAGLSKTSTRIGTETTGPREMSTLAIDSSLARRVLRWRDLLSPTERLDWTRDWYAACADGADMRAVTLEQIDRFTDKAAQHA
jgi:CDP-glucose 4,6-dehydratase